MHEALIPSDQLDDFIILRARAFTSTMKRVVARDVLKGEALAVLEWQLLFSVARFGACHLAYITQRTSIDPAHGSRAAAALEKKGMITRCRDPAHKRRKLITLTPEGVETFERIWPRARQAVKTVTEQLGAQDFQDLKRLLDLLNEATAPLENEIQPAARNQAIQTEEFGQIAPAT